MLNIVACCATFEKVLFRPECDKDLIMGSKIFELPCSFETSKGLLPIPPCEASSRGLIGLFLKVSATLKEM
jgi:hypothetical protein